MSCDEIRSRLMAADPVEATQVEIDPAPADAVRGDRARPRSGTSDEVASHLAACAACAEFAARLALARDALRDHRAEHLPDPHFARRVSAAVPRGSDLLGWAAVRLLPATLGLALVLTAWCWLATPGPGALVEQSPTDDLLAWALEEDGS